jgi:Zn-dependent peptidase ImmA (M78 family)
MAHLTVSNSVLRWALDRSGKAEAILKKFPKLPTWISGQRQPTLHQLEALATATQTPFGFFFLPQPPDVKLTIPLFRSRGNESVRPPSPDLIESVQTMQRRQAWMRDFLIEEGAEPLAMVRSAGPDDTPEEVAQKIRQALGVEAGWAARQPTWTAALRELFKIVEDAGILVVVNGIVANNTHRKLDPLEFRGFVLVDEYAPLVFLNGSDGKAAQMFTMAHELAHVWYGSSAAFDLRNLQPADEETERACDRVAAEFLVPQAELRALWASAKRTKRPYQVAAVHFKVSEIVAARRLRDLKLISNTAFFEFYEHYLEQERRSHRGKGGGDFYATQNSRVGRRFAEAVVIATRSGRLLYSEAFHLTDLHGKTFDRYAESIGLGRAG